MKEILELTTKKDKNGLDKVIKELDTWMTKNIKLMNDFVSGGRLKHAYQAKAYVLCLLGRVRGRSSFRIEFVRFRDG